MTAQEIRASLSAEERLALIDRVMRELFFRTDSWGEIGCGLSYWTWAVLDRKDPEGAFVDWRDGEEAQLLRIFRELFPPDLPENAKVWAFIRV